MRLVNCIALMILVTFTVCQLDGQEVKYEWKSANKDQELLYQDGQIVGQWYKPEGMYYSWDGVKNGEASKPPIDPPATALQSALVESWKNNMGIDVSKMLPHHLKEHITFGGKVIQSHELEDAIAGNLFADDSSKGYLVIVSKDKAKRDAVYADFQKLPAAFTSRYNVWMAAPDHLSMQDRFNAKPRFFTEGDPTVILQDATGVVLFRRPQAEQRYKSSDIQALLKSDPNYKPELDPGAPDAPAFSIPNLPPAAWAAGGVLASGVLLFLFRRLRS